MTASAVCHDNFCGHRFDGQYGELPAGYDHKYVYSHFGYNLKVTDMQAAIGCEQLKKFPSFIERRRHNWDRLRAALEPVADKLILPEPAANKPPVLVWLPDFGQAGIRPGPQRRDPLY